MSVGANPSGITPRVAQVPQATRNAQANQAANQAQANASARSAQAPNANVNAPILTSTVVVAQASPQAAPASGLPTAPAARGFNAAQAMTRTPVAQTAAAMAAAAMMNPAVLGALQGIAVVATRTKAKSTGDAKEEAGDVEVETESEIQPDALQDSNQGEQGAGEINASGGATGPSTYNG